MRLSGKNVAAFSLGICEVLCCFIVLFDSNFVRWCEQDLCPVAAKQARGCYNHSAARLDAALVYDQLIQDWCVVVPEPTVWPAY